MARQWHNEPWRKLYTRVDGPWLRLPALTRGIASELLKYADDYGVLCTLEPGEEAAPAVAALLAPHPAEVGHVTGHVTRLVTDGYVTVDRDIGTVTIRNFVEAQCRLSPEAVRKRRQRDKDRANAGHVTGRSRDMSRDKSRDSHGETRRDETSVCTPVTTWRTGLEQRWIEATGAAGFGAPRLSEVADRVEQAAQMSGREPAALFGEVVAEFQRYRATCTPPFVPGLTPAKILEHWPTIWERLTGTQPAKDDDDSDSEIHPSIAEWHREERERLRAAGRLP